MQLFVRTTLAVAAVIVGIVALGLILKLFVVAAVIAALVLAVALVLRGFRRGRLGRIG